MSVSYSVSRKMKRWPVIIYFVIIKHLWNQFLGHTCEKFPSSSEKWVIIKQLSHEHAWSTWPMKYIVYLDGITSPKKTDYIP